MISVALIGADGAGKTTIVRKLEEGFEKPIKYLYIGVSMQSSNAALPTSRLAHWMKRKISKKKGVKMESGPPVNADGTIERKKKSGLRSVLRLANRLAEERYRQYLSWKFRRQGNVEYLEARRQAFLKQGENIPNFVRVDATQPLETVYSQVSDNILEYCRLKTNELGPNG